MLEPTVMGTEGGGHSAPLLANLATMISGYAQRNAHRRYQGRRPVLDDLDAPRGL